MAVVTPRCTKMKRRVRNRGVLGHEVGLSRVGQPRANGVDLACSVCGMAVETHVVVVREDRLRRTEVRRCLEVVRMMALQTAELLAMLGKMHGVLEFLLDSSE